MISGKEISVVIPILNEVENIAPLLNEMENIVSDCGFSQIQEIIFVDDGSQDGTVDAVKSKMGHYPFNVRLIERGEKLGTVSATLVGCNQALSDAVIVMDGDLQHPPHVMLELARRMHDGHDLIIASRHTRGGRNIWKPLRGVISRAAIFISYLLIPSAREVKDPTSGFFMVRKELISELSPLHGKAKILLYVLSSLPGLKTLEVPYTFVDRKNGTSKIVGSNLRFVTDYLIEIIGYMRIANRSKMPAESSTSTPTAMLHE